MELSYWVGDMLVESLWVRIKRQANKDHIGLGLCKRPLNQVRKWIKFSSNMEVSGSQTSQYFWEFQPL